MCTYHVQQNSPQNYCSTFSMFFFYSKSLNVLVVNCTQVSTTDVSVVNIGVLSVIMNFL